MNIDITNNKFHECEDLKKENEKIPEELYNVENPDDAEVDIIYDGEEWSIGIPYMNSEWDQINKAYRRIRICPYCGVIL
ncbi:hypothetical protein [uncultured Clostridium sp.]|uniref:hypothetical protein n=1 Tax=uncultured Clostridium sp. TaxID=59620 RepID=UPI0028E52EAF|nr:hypothetical protein [uncultured Clostridium sp.]